MNDRLTYLQHDTADLGRLATVLHIRPYNAAEVPTTIALSPRPPRTI